MKPEQCVIKAFEVSTGHIPQATDELLSQSPVWLDGIFRYKALECGWRIYMPLTHDVSRVVVALRLHGLNELAELIRLADEHDCTLLDLDGGADVIDGLPFFDW